MNDVFVGLESSMDVWTSLTSLEALLNLSEETKSGMEDELRLAYKGLKDNAGDEIPVDGKDIDVLMEELKPISRMRTSIGGGAAIQCSQFLSLGCRAHFLGNYYPEQIGGSLFSKSNFSLGQPSKLNPRSIVLQFSGDRFILGMGRGRRIEDLRGYINRLPQIVVSSPRPDAISLVGWHVLFAHGVKEADLDCVVSSLQAIRKLKIPMFTDTGGFGKMDDNDITKLWEIYSEFDIVGMNEKEFLRLSKVLSLDGDENERLRKLKDMGEIIETIWLHARDYQKSISTRFDEVRLSLAQEFSSAAGCLRVETGGFPSKAEIDSRSDPGRSTESRGIVETTSLKSRRFSSEVGAGDVSSASFLWRLFD